MSLRRFLVGSLGMLVSALLLMAAAPVGSPADFAALTIRPQGSEAFDLATGITTLPEGGTVAYKDEGVTLEGEFIRYREGEFIEIEKASVTGAFGTLSSPALRFDVATQLLTASAGAAFEGPALKLEADIVKLTLNDDIAVLKGNVTSQSPELASEQVLVDTTGQQALLIGPYAFHNGPVVLRGNAGKTLALTWDDKGNTSAETSLPPTVQERFAAHLP